ncbi:MAG: beta-propeller fold lactonase family protein [Desulfobacteraceae bacterium]|nr:beta-propeller fold lactonase family protein [Desulfobacteraceae bacterium]
MKTLRCLNIFFVSMLVLGITIVLCVSRSSSSTPKIEIADITNISNTFYFPEQEGDPSWNSDGTKIIFSKGCDYTAGGPGSVIALMNADGSDIIDNITNHHEPFGNHQMPDFNKDDNEIVFTALHVNGSRLMVMDWNGTEATNLRQIASSTDGRQIKHPNWHPNEDKILYSCEYVYTIDPETGIVEQLPLDEQYGYDRARWSPDGTKIVFLMNDRSLPYPNKHIYVMNYTMDPNEINLIQLTSGEELYFEPSWSPDGEYIVFNIRDLSKNVTEDLWIIKADGSEEPYRILDMDAASYPQWHPNGDAIAFFRFNSNSDPWWCTQDIYIANLGKKVCSYPNEEIASLSMSDSPKFVAVAPDGEHVYITHWFLNMISVIRTSDNTLVDTISVGEHPSGMAFGPIGEFLYVPNWGNDTVSIIRTSDNTVVGSFGVDSHPEHIAITPNGEYAYTTSGYFTKSVSVIRLSDNTKVASVTVGEAPLDLLITPNGDYVYVSNRNGHSVSVIQTSDNTVIDTIQVGDIPFGLAITPDTKYVYVVKHHANTVSVIDTGTNTVIDTIVIEEGNLSMYPVVTPDGKYVFVNDAENDSVSVIQISTNTVVDTIPIGDYPYGMDIAPDGNKIYVANHHGHTVSVIACRNSLPIVDAGENITISSEEICSTSIIGTASDEDFEDNLAYRWTEGETVLLDWTSVGSSGECPLNLCTTSLGIGPHTLSLEVTDGENVCSDNMILAIDNSSPNAAPSGAGVYEIGFEVILGGDVSDFDGDMLIYKWMEGGDILCEGNITANAGGEFVTLEECKVTNLSLGIHNIILQVDDGINNPVQVEITVEITDSTAPTLALESNLTILWPPNHNMVEIVIEANAQDISGLPVTLMAEVLSNEPADGLGDGDMTPDWTDPTIDQNTGLITLQLRAERSGSGEGRKYTITIIATDPSNNSSSADVIIIVPHDKKKK